jgi:MFS family permease
MQNVAQSWLIYKMTGNDPIYLGWLGLAFAVPMVVAPPLGGIVADRAERVRLLFVTQSAMTVLSAALAALAWAGLLRPWHILAAVFVGGLLLAFDNPARQVLIPSLVPRQDLQNALSLGSATFTGPALVGPAIAGALLEPLGAAGLFLLNAISYVAVLATLAALRGGRGRSMGTSALRHAMLGGFAYVMKDRAMLALLVLAAAAALSARSYPQLLPMFADDVWRAGPAGYGVLLSAGGAGALVGAVGLSGMRDIERKERVLLGAGVALSLSLVVFALAPSIRLGAVCLVCAGVASTVFTTMCSTAMQLRVPSELRGRVMSLFVITLIGLPSLGSLGLAVVARRSSAERAVLFGAALFVTVLAVAARPIARQLRPRNK